MNNDNLPIVVKIKMLEGCEDLFPVKAHYDDAAFDLRSRVDAEILPAKSYLIPTGIFIEVPIHYEAQIRPRSGLALKHTITLTNTPGTVDSGYRGEVGVIILNAGTEKFTVNRGDRIAQMVINKLPEVKLISVKELSPSTRGEGGFGSTGKN